MQGCRPWQGNLRRSVTCRLGTEPSMGRPDVVEEKTMANPVFDRIDKQITKGDYAGFDRGPAVSGMSAGSGVQDSLNPQQLQDLYNQPSAGPVQMRRVTLDDVVMKPLGLFTIVLLVRSRPSSSQSSLASRIP